MQTNRIPSLDGLRAISVIFVVVGHVYCNNLSLLLAAFGVQIFFVISGYLITSLLQREHERAGKIGLGAFYRRRIFRIFPAALVYMFAVALFSSSSRPDLIYALTYTTSYKLNIVMPFSHLWSLSVEEQFYLLWPLALVFCFRRRAAIAWSAMGFAAVFRLTLAMLNPTHSAVYRHFSFPGTMDSIAAGCLLAIYEPEVRSMLGWMSDIRAIIIAIPIVAWLLHSVCWVGAAGALYGIVPLLIAASMFLFVQRRDWFLNNWISVEVGVLSYSLYLWQQPFVVGHLVRPEMLAVLAAASCAVASYFLVEAPMIRLGRVLGKKPGWACFLKAAAEPKPTPTRLEL